MAKLASFNCSLTCFSYLLLVSHMIFVSVFNEVCVYKLLSFKAYMSILEVMSPQGADLILATHVPNCETDVLVLHSLHIETYKRKIILQKTKTKT